jgi:N-acylethanolamine-hydrolysing acid amidase
MEEALMGNYFYELSDVTENLPEEWHNVATRACTGIVAQNANGTVMMGRNQDYPPPFSPLQYDGTFVKNGTVIFEGTSFAGTVGMGGTCMVPGKWSAEINARGANKPSLAEAIKSAAAGDPAFPNLLRKGCERGGDFEDALKFLSDTPLILGGYITMAGAKPGEGAIITRNAAAEGTDVLRLKDGYPTDEPFYLVQTNYDHWTDPPTSDDRRVSAKCLMENLGPQNVDLDALWGVMSDTGKGQCKSHRGVYNSATIHTELVVPATGEYHTYLRHNIIEDVVV